MLHRARVFIFLICVILNLIFAPVSEAYITKSGNIYDSDGSLVTIDGLAWIGFQDDNFLGGLWDVGFNPSSTQHGAIELITSPWSVPGSGVTSPSNGVSFHTIRLPIQPGIWRNKTSLLPYPYDPKQTNFNDQEAGNGPFCDWTQGADANGQCLKPKAAADLLSTTINEFQKHNLRVMLDFHHRPGLSDSFRDGTVVASDYTLQNYHDDLVNFLSSAPSNVLGIDLYNEPYKLFWFQANNQVTPVQPAWINVIAAAATAAYDTNQRVLLFVEGAGGSGHDPDDPIFSSTNAICLPASTTVDNTGNIGLGVDSQRCPTSTNPMRVTYLGSNWGENFRELLDPVKARSGIAAFNVQFFRTKLIEAIKSNNFSSTSSDLIADWLLGPNNDGNNGHLVFAPHLYGSATAGWQTDPHDSPIRFDWNFGFLLKSGFPFVIGELGFDLQLPASGAEDFFLYSVAPYLIKNGVNHNLFFWTFNAGNQPPGLRPKDSNLTLFPWKELDLHNLFYANVDAGSLHVSASSASDSRCSSASDTLYLDGSTTGVPFTVSNGVLQTLSTGSHQLKIASSMASIPAGGTNSGSCTGDLSATQVTVSSGKTTEVTVTYTYHPSAPTGTIRLVASANSDSRCSSASDTLHLDNDSKGTSFVVSKGASLATLVGSHSLRLDSSSSPVSAGGGQLGLCSGTLSSNQVTVIEGQTASVEATYTYQAPAGMSCTVTSAKVTQQSNWGLLTPVNTFQIAVSLTGFPPYPTSVAGTLVMVNPFVQSFWGNFPMSSTYSGATGKFTGSLYSTRFTLGGFITNAVPLSVGSNPLMSMTVNGVRCSIQ